MKKNFFLLLCGFLMVSALFSCNDDNTVGSSVQPDKDIISVNYDTVHLHSETVIVDSVYFRNSIAMLGEFTDGTFGTTKSDFMAQLYCARHFSFPDDVTRIDSAYIYFYYNKWFGDSSTVHHVNIYQLNRSLDDDTTYFSNINPRNYYSESDLIAQGSFTAGDFIHSDSAQALSSYSKVVRIPIRNLALAQKFLADSRDLSTKSAFETPENFQQYFKGIYVTTDMGNGSILYINQVQMEFCFDTRLVRQSTGVRDSVVIGAAYFPITKEVKQINRTDHNDLSKYIETNFSDSLNYVFAPGGMFTKVTIPERIFKKDEGLLSNKTISSFNLKVMATSLDNGKYAMAPPEALLLINAANVNAFFNKFELSDGLNSFLAKYDSNAKNYVFDLSRYAQKMIHKFDGTGSVENFTPFTDLLIIPVSIVSDDDGAAIRLEHLMTPSAVKVRSGNHPTQPMKLEIVYARYQSN
ncbi:MAG: DUF4270 domain-containing protein [Bacteroidales bacterium]|nr:DUF4270 domain-containing protein [Bacteroidales bacterium]